MAYVYWMIRTKQIGACSCDYGCPCEFNAPPTRLPCEGVIAMEIAEGHFGDVKLDGLRVAGVYRWPGAVREGNGTWWSVVGRRASEDQVNALFTILGGQEQEPTTGFAIYASTIANEPDPVFADIGFEFDPEARRGRFSVNNVLEADVSPIKNPVTGEEHHIAIRPHRGFEFREAEMANATFWSRGEQEQMYAGRYAALSFVSYGPQGIIAEESFPNRSH